MADIFTEAGEDFVTDQMDPSTAGTITNFFIAQGTAAGTILKADTTLDTEASESRVATTNSQPNTNESRYVATITADGTKTIFTAGVFDASTSGTLICASDFGGIAVDSGDSIQFTFTITWT